MALRRLLRETQLPLKALFCFPEENMTGTGPTKINHEKENAVLGEMVSVNWQGKMVKGKIIGPSGKYPSIFQLSTQVAQFGHIVQPVLICFSFVLLDRMEERNKTDPSWSEENFKKATLSRENHKRKGNVR